MRNPAYAHVWTKAEHQRLVDEIRKKEIPRKGTRLPQGYWAAIANAVGNGVTATQAANHYYAKARNEVETPKLRAFQRSAKKRKKRAAKKLSAAKEQIEVTRIAAPEVKAPEPAAAPKPAKRRRARRKPATASSAQPPKTKPAPSDDDRLLAFMARAAEMGLQDSEAWAFVAGRMGELWVPETCRRRYEVLKQERERGPATLEDRVTVLESKFQRVYDDVREVRRLVERLLERVDDVLPRGGGDFDSDFTRPSPHEERDESSLEPQ